VVVHDGTSDTAGKPGLKLWPDVCWIAGVDRVVGLVLKLAELGAEFEVEMRREVRGAIFEKLTPGRSR
jgi:hypothetical protein